MTKSKFAQIRDLANKQPTSLDNQVDIVHELKKVKTFSAGYVSGVTRIPQPTMRRYVILYRRHFSPEAQINTRGRRFSHKDIEMLVFIHDEYRLKSSREEIDGKLDGDWKANQKDRYQPEILRIGLQVAKLQTEVEFAARNALAHRNEQQRLSGLTDAQLQNWNDRLNGLVNAYNRHINRKITRWEWIKAFFSNKIPC